MLARKWRPRNFKELVGQVHVLQALVNALDNDRLHHAYLFTGTRGVGKTTIARILAKCLNCEAGVTSEPCGQCSSCREIDEGRFVDLIEVDAASRTRLEDTKELLDNVQYAPTRGRFKVYLIDEVHMLSTHSFNALLKTLEEPPPHVKFLLATTDPHKLPVTILSRCLQFSLKNMPPERVVGHLQTVLEGESISYDMPALWQLGRAADGSMRDALSLTDQAIAYCGEGLTNQGVTAMLGTIDQAQVYRVLDALAAGQAKPVLDATAELSEHSPDYVAVLADMLSALHRVALAQALPDVVDNSQGDRDHILALTRSMAAEDVQLYYQIGLIGRKDLPLAPDPRSGFEMVLLRMLAFRPDGVPSLPQQSLPEGGGASDNGALDGGVADGVLHDMSAAPDAGADSQPDIQGEQKSAEFPSADKSEPVKESETQGVSDMQSSEPLGAAPFDAPSPPPEFYDAPPPVDYPDAFPDEGRAPTGENVDQPIHDEQGHPQQVASDRGGQVVDEAEYAQVAEGGSSEGGPSEKEPSGAGGRALAGLQPSGWIELSQNLGMGGVTGAIVSHCELTSIAGNQLILRLDQDHDTLYNDNHRQRIELALSEYFGEPVVLEVQAGVVEAETPAVWRERRRRERQEAARRSFHADDKVQAIVETFSATILDHTIEPVG